MDSKKNETKKKLKKVEKEPIKKEFNKEKVQSVIIVVLSLIIVFGLAYVVPELKNCGNCKEEEVTLTSITMDDYNEILAGEEVSIVYLASPNCGYCQLQKPIMEELIREYGITVNYLNTSTITSDEANEVYKLYGSTQEASYGVDGVRTPTILLVQKGKLLAMRLGNTELEELVTMLKEYINIGE